MATRSKAEPSAAKEWSAKTLAEFPVKGTAAVWRAQISTAPDGKRFAGIRKYFVKKDGTERADRAGLSFLIDEESPTTTATALAKVANLLVEVSNSLAAGKRSEKARVKAKPTEEKWALQKGTKYLKTWFKDGPEDHTPEVTVTSNAALARTWNSEEEATTWKSKRKISTKGFEVVALTSD